MTTEAGDEAALSSSVSIRRQSPARRRDTRRRRLMGGGWGWGAGWYKGGRGGDADHHPRVADAHDYSNIRHEKHNNYYRVTRCPFQLRH